MGSGKAGGVMRRFKIHVTGDWCTVVWIWLAASDDETA